MPDYIEREAAIAWFMPYVHAEESIEADVVISDLKGMKAADVEPVRHGRWVKDGEVVVCSECGEEHAWDEYRATYCEDCGAKMDLEVEHAQE